MGAWKTSIKGGAIVFGLLLGLILPARAATFLVTTTADAGAGSLRQAIANANITPGADVINFNIPGSGVQTLTPASPLPAISDPVNINGYSQPGSSMNTLANADNAVLLIEINGAVSLQFGLDINLPGSGSTIRGLVINRVAGGVAKGIIIRGNNCIIQGNFIGTDPTGTIAFNLSGDGIQTDTSSGGGSDNTIGGVLPGQRNVISGNRFNGISINGDNNVIQGNFIGVDATGAKALPNGADGGLGVRIGNSGTGTLVGGTIAGARNIISGNASGGLEIIADLSCCNVVQGNFIGTDATGTKPLGNGGSGVDLSFSLGGNLIGGTTPEARNVISGNGTSGVVLQGAAETGDEVQGNFIGTDVTGTLALGNGFDGVVILSANSASIGGTTVGAGNIIAHNGRFGISVLGNAGINNALLGNSIFDNRSLGIGLLSDGVTLNDPSDADEGPNHLQNYPVLTSVGTAAGTTSVAGSLNSTANTTFRLEFFSNVSIDPSGFGEGQTFLGSSNVTTDPSGNASFNVGFPQIAAGRRVTATATDPAGNTSEFSAALGQLLNISTRLRVQTDDNVL
ncbi:MAG: hypothetical protein H0X11_04590, partial [Betaproteobacteria bacterium]|nr:hypothetical protein [Betaproteobacteria bacterium]